MDLQIRLANADDMAQIMALQALSLRTLSTQAYNAEQIEALVRSQSTARVQSFNAGNELIYVACLTQSQGPSDEVGTQNRQQPSKPISAKPISAKPISQKQYPLRPEKAGQIVAIAALASRCTKIGAMYVHPDFARQGIASQLLHTIETVAIENHQQVMRVLSSMVAIPFYEAMGYQRLRYREIYFEGEMIGCMEMGKALAAKNRLLALAKQLTSAISLMAGSIGILFGIVFGLMWWAAG